MYTKLQTLGDLTKANPQSHIEDIGTIAARCLVDARTLNKFVQFDKRRLSQNDFFEMVERLYPGRRFDRVHVTSEEIVHGKTHGSESASSAASGHEPDRERHGINFVCWVDDRGVFGPYNENTLNAGKFGINFPCLQTPPAYSVQAVSVLTLAQPSCSRITSGALLKKCSGDDHGGLMMMMAILMMKAIFVLLTVIVLMPILLL